MLYLNLLVSCKGTSLDWDALHREISDANNGEHFVTDAAPEIIARIFGTKKQFVAGKPAFELHGSGNNKVFRANFTQAIKGAQWGETPSTSMQLGTDGQLKGMRGSSFKELAARLDKSDEYELLRGEILSIFCDLVLPAHLIDDVEHVEKEVLREKHGKQRDVQTIRRIVLARVRLLQERKPEVISEIKKEMRKRPDEHGVIGFIRALPQGRRANAEQRELCRRNLGKELAAEGETYVREHKRGGNVDKGEVNGVQGHRAIRRNVGGGIVQAAGLPRPSISK